MSSNIIVGGGVIGLFCARALSQHGEQVLLLEQDVAAGQEASWAGGGVGSATYPWREPEATSLMSERGAKLYAELAKELLHETGYDVQWWQTGLLMMACKEYAQAHTWALHYQHPIELLTAEQVKKVAPNIHCATDNNIWLPKICEIRNPRLLKALLASLQKKINVEIKAHCTVTDLERYHDAIVKVHTNQGTFSADRIIITAGAWSGGLLARLGWEIPIFPVRGQILLWQLSKNLLSMMISEENHYLIPRQDNYLLAGGTLEKVGFDKRTTEAAYVDIYNNAVRLLPALKNEPVVKHWAGLRPGSPQGIPYVGLMPGMSNLWINAGHFRNGLNMAPASAELLIDLIFDRQPQLPPALYQKDIYAQ